MIAETSTLIKAADPVLVKAFFENKQADERLAALDTRCRSALVALGTPVPEVFLTAASELQIANNEVARKRSVLRESQQNVIAAIAKDMAGVSEGQRVHVQYQHSSTSRDAGEVREVAMLVKRLRCKWTTNLVFPMLKGFRLREDGTLTQCRIEVDLQPGLNLTQLG